ncbi:hypothetical protein NG99_18900 [Erwinia typographi]|uniref:Uncharacterized protein n=1 Tax=Erwinia typographi TaxID=371042 RepID=A0A0A3YRZ1_9GAMM|nr:hypothetical protein NG99_18900 [Erwinia typographi]
MFFPWIIKFILMMVLTYYIYSSIRMMIMILISRIGAFNVKPIAFLLLLTEVKPGIYGRSLWRVFAVRINMSSQHPGRFIATDTCFIMMSFFMT